MSPKWIFEIIALAFFWTFSFSDMISVSLGYLGINVGLLFLLGSFGFSFQYLNLRLFINLLISLLLPAAMAYFFYERPQLLSCASLLFLLFSHRLAWYFYLNPESRKKKMGSVSILIYGAGSVGHQILQDLMHEDLEGRYQIAAFIDNDSQKIGTRIGSYKVYSKNELTKVIHRFKIQEIWFTMPLLGGFLEEVLEKLKDLPVTYKVVPRKIHHLIPDTRALRIEDLIERPEIHLPIEPVSKLLFGKRVIVTGAAGSIGKEIVNQISIAKVEKLILVDQWEQGIFELQKRMKNDSRVEYQLLTTKDKTAIKNLIEKEKPDFIFHSAAYKHVPIMESNFEEAVKTNILGSYYLIKSVYEWLLTPEQKNHTVKIINISTDKAVEPRSIMGITKAISEIIAFDLSSEFKSKTGENRLNTLSVRFGNVLGSSGSVVPLFWEQIQSGDPITVTHPEMERFFMTIPEAVRLVLHSIRVHGEQQILAFDMGESVRITNLAERLISLAGLVPHKDIKINYSQVRPGEKLKEKIFWKNNSETTNIPFIYKSDVAKCNISVEEMIVKIHEALLKKHSLEWWKKFLINQLAE